jgi:hypothetical protein
MRSRHHHVVQGSVASATNGLYRRLLRAKEKPAVLLDLVDKASNASLEHLSQLPVRPPGLLRAMHDVCNACATLRVDGAPTNSTNIIWNDLRDQVEANTNTFTSSLLLSSFKPFEVEEKYRQSVREILWHAHASCLTLETMSSLDQDHHRQDHHQNQQNQQNQFIPFEYAISNILDSVKALSVEKYGVSPLVAVEVDAGDEDAQSLIGVVEVHLQEILYMEYCLVELLKNSFGSMISKYGALEVEEETPVVLKIKVSQENGFAGLVVKDTGTGMSREELERCCEPLHTSALEQQDDPWRYSRTFGARFAGAGLGTFKSHVNFDFLGATKMRVESNEGTWTKVEVKCLK